LPNFQVYYQNLRGLHWNVQGKKLFELHQKFEELYNQAQLRIDEIAERVLTLGGTPLHTFTDYMELNKIKVGKNISNDEEAVELIIASLSMLLELARVIFENSGAISDEVMSSVMSDLLTDQQKEIWIMRAFLG